MGHNYDTIFICIAERGILEPYTLLLIKSIRKYGGKYAKAPIFCYQPRKSYPIGRKTIKELQNYDVNFVNEDLNRQFEWYALANKPLVINHAVQNYSSKQYVFLDSDTLVLNEPELFSLDQSSPISLSPVMLKGKGSNLMGDENFELWKIMLNVMEGDLITVKKMVETSIDEKIIAGYWNSGVIGLSGGSHIIEEWISVLHALLKRPELIKRSIYFLEQLSLAIAIHKANEDVQALSIYNNFGLSPYRIYHNKYKKFEPHKIAILHHMGRFDYFLNYLQHNKSIDIEEFKEKVDWVFSELKPIKVYPKSGYDNYYRICKLIQCLKERSAYFYNMKLKNW
jgi:hypothetical protein